MAITEEKALIKIASETSGAQIRYTINGDDPTESDTLYTSSGVELDYGDVLRARAFKSGSMPSGTNVYENRTPIISFEKVCDLDFLWNGQYKATYTSYNINYTGYHDQDDFIFKIKLVNNYYFMLGYDKKDVYNNSEGNSYSAKYFVKYSSNLKDWHDLNLEDNCCVTDIEYFNNKYVAVCKRAKENSIYDDGSKYYWENAYNNAYAICSVSTNTTYISPNLPMYGWYIIQWDTLESSASYKIISDKSLNVNLNTYSGSSDFAYFDYGCDPMNINLYIANDRLIFTLMSYHKNDSYIGNNYILYTKDLINFNCVKVDEVDNNSSYSTKHVNKIYFSYINGKYYLQASVGENTSYAYVRILSSPDLINWERVFTFSDSSGSNNGYPLYIKDNLMFVGHTDSTKQRPNYFNITNVLGTPTSIGEVNLAAITDFESKNSMLLAASTEEYLYYSFNFSSFNGITLPYYTPEQGNQSGNSPQDYYMKSTYIYAYPFFKSKEGNIYIILQSENEEGKTTTSSAADPWPQDDRCNMYSIYKINID